MSWSLRKSARRPALSPPEQARQGRAVNLAIAALGPAAAPAFLNALHPALSRRPIDLAIESDAGLDAVIAALGPQPPVRRQAPTIGE